MPLNLSVDSVYEISGFIGGCNERWSKVTKFQGYFEGCQQRAALVGRSVFGGSDALEFLNALEK